MVSKNRTTIAAVAAVTLAGFALLPSASAATSNGYFGVQSVNSTDSSIKGYAGMADPSKGSGETTPVPCSLDFTAPTGSVSYSDTANNQYLLPRGSDGTYGYSDWISKVLESGGSVEVSEPTIQVSGVEVSNPDSNSNWRGTVDFSEFKPYVGTAKAVPAGTLTLDAFQSPYNTDEQKDSVNHGAVQIAGLNTDRIQEALQSDSFKAKVGANADSSVRAQELKMSYTITASWPAGSTHANCSTEPVNLNYSYWFGAE